MIINETGLVHTNYFLNLDSQPAETDQNIAIKYIVIRMWFFNNKS